MPRNHWIAAVLIGVFTVLATAHTLIPIFEGPDEIAHYRYVRYLAENRALPPPAGLERGQYHQAPLYYALAAPVLAVVDDADFEQIAANENPYFGVSFNVPGNDNKAIFLHTAREDFPYTGSGTALAAHLIRLVSVACGVVTMIAAYGVFRLLWPGRAVIQLTALGLLATWNQFIYTASVINNDALLIALATVSLYVLLWAVKNGPSWRWAGVFGLVLGLALLSKSSALVLGFFVGVTVVLQPRFWRYVPLILVVCFGLAGFWYARNWMLVGDFTGMNAMAETWSSEMIMPDNSSNLRVGLVRSGYAYQTAWNRLGSGAISLPPPVYRVFDGLVLLAGGGLLVRLVRHIRSGGRAYQTRRQQIVVTVLVFTLIWWPMLIYFAGLAYSGNQGRYLLTAIVGWAALLTWGLLAWIPRRFKAVAGTGLVLAAGALAAVTYAGYVLPAYRPLPSDVSADAPLYRYEDVAELLAVEQASDTVAGREHTTITLHWRALRPAERELLTYVHSLESEAIRRDSYPGTGTLRATEWERGQQWAERFVIRRAETAAPQQQVTLLAGLYDPAADAALPATTPKGETVIPEVGTLTIQGEPEPFEAAYIFGQTIGLAQPTVSGGEVCLSWSARGDVSTNYAVYVHARTAGGEIVAQQDHRPKDGRYPTSGWLPGEVVSYCVAHPAPGAAEVAVGLYNPDSGQRPPLRTSDGESLPAVVMQSNDF